MRTSNFLKVQQKWGGEQSGCCFVCKGDISQHCFNLPFLLFCCMCFAYMYVCEPMHACGEPKRLLDALALGVQLVVRHYYRFLPIVRENKKCLPKLRYLATLSPISDPVWGASCWRVLGTKPESSGRVARAPKGGVTFPTPVPCF